MSRPGLAGIALVVIGVAVGLEATTFDTVFLTDPVGPKALPLLAAVTMVLAGVLTWRRPPPVTLPDRSTLGRLAAAAAVFLLYAATLGLVGFLVSTTLVVAGLARLYGAPFRKGLPSAAALSAVLWVVFVYGLSLPLPIGDLWIR